MKLCGGLREIVIAVEKVVEEQREEIERIKKTLEDLMWKLNMNDTKSVEATSPLVEEAASRSVTSDNFTKKR